MAERENRCLLGGGGEQQSAHAKVPRPSGKGLPPTGGVLPAGQLFQGRTERNALNWAVVRQITRSDRANVFRLRFAGLPVLTNVVTDLRAVAKRPTRQYARDMDKDILPAIVGRNETKALVLIEKLNGARRHVILVN